MNPYKEAVSIVNDKEETTLYTHHGVYAKKTTNEAVEDPFEKSHYVGFPVCNFQCGFCSTMYPPKGFKIDTQGFATYTAETFRARVAEMIAAHGATSFKFSGGEITLVRNLRRLLEAARAEGGSIYLDTNASMPDRILPLIDAGLIDVLGLSLKGLDPDSAMQTADIKNKRLCWDNPISVIRESVRRSETIAVPVTLVINDSADISKLLEFADLLETLDSERHAISMKINNLMPGGSRTDLRPLERTRLSDMAHALVEARSNWKGRTIVILGPEGVGDQSGILKL